MHFEVPYTVEKCLVKVEYPACYVRQGISVNRLDLQRNPYLGACPLEKRIELVPSSDGVVKVYINGEFWREFRGCVR